MYNENVLFKIKAITLNVTPYNRATIVAVNMNDGVEVVIDIANEDSNNRKIIKEKLIKAYSSRLEDIKNAIKIGDII